MTLYILEYNNYYNRLVKQEESLEAYQQYIIYELINTNFNPADKVNTQHVIGNGDYDGSGDYVIAVNEDGTINSRWFIIQADRTRAGQWQLTLHRDVVVDYYNIIIESPMFIEKATLPDSDPFIYNSENMTFNQKKVDQILLPDETGCPWVVGYIPRDSFKNDSLVEATIKLSPDIANITVDSLSNWEYNSYRNKLFNGVPISLNYNVYIYGSMKWDVSGSTSSGWQVDHQTLNGTYKFTVNKEGFSGQTNWPKAVLNTKYPEYNTSGWSFDGKVVSGNYYFPPISSDYAYPSEQASSSQVYIMNYPTTGQINSYYVDALLPGYRPYINQINTAAAGIANYATASQVEAFRALSGQVIYETDTQTFYKIVITPKDNASINTKVPVDNSSSSLFTLLKNNLAMRGKYSVFLSSDPGSTTFSIEAQVPTYQLEIRKMESLANVTLNSNRLHLDDSPYDMFCMPYSDTFTYKANGVTYTASKSVAKNIATEIGADTGSGNIYDVQLLPYCPIRYAIKADGTFDSGNTPIHVIYDSQEETKAALGVIFWANSSTFSFPISKQLSVSNLKISNQTDMWRLCSPNGSGMFEFSVAKNGGSVDYFNVDCTYKPFNPYIHIAPNFAGLYVQDWDDYRGLTCGGDFSLAQISNAWADYELNNKNYQAMFDRNIQTMRKTNDIQKEMDIANAVAGGISGAASGATAGAMAGGWIGAIVGGVVGAAGSGITGALDVKYNEMLRNESLTLTMDQFGYQLGNIQAVPSSITKTSALTANNPLLPYIEYYTCSDKEKQALQNKIKYNGMTVMRIGTIKEFLQPELSYIKGKLIRLEDDNINFHVINTISGELNKGVYI